MTEAGTRRRANLLWTRAAWLSLPVAVLLFTSCGGEDGDGSGTQTDAGGGSLTSADFDDLPLPPGAEPAGERSERGGVTVRSYFVSGTTPERVLDFYASTFADQGARMVDMPAAAGSGAWRGRWLIGGRLLLVSATRAPTAESDSDDGVTQFSLELAPRGEDARHDGGDG